MFRVFETITSYKFLERCDGLLWPQGRHLMADMLYGRALGENWEYIAEEVHMKRQGSVLES